MGSVIFKTDADTLPGVLKHVKHAFQRPPDLVRGDLILIAQTLASLRTGLRQIRYQMSFVRTREDKDNETDRIWGHHWDYIVDGESLKSLAKPFNISMLRAPHANYAQGGPFVYLHPADENTLREQGYLNTRE